MACVIIAAQDTLPFAEKMLQEYNTEDAISLTIALSLLACFLKTLIDANLNAWSNVARDKAIAKENDREYENKKGKKKGCKNRLSERELLSNAWFGGPCGLLAPVVKWHKVRKPMFLLGYCCRCCTGVCVSLLALLVYLVLGLPRIVFHWSSAKDVMLRFVEWSEQFRSVLHF